MNLFELPDFSRATQDIKATTSSALQTPHLTATNELIYIYLVLDHNNLLVWYRVFFYGKFILGMADSQWPEGF